MRAALASSVASWPGVMLSARVGTGRHVPPRPSRNPGPAETLATSYPSAPSMARAATWATLNARRSKVPALRAWSTRRTAASASWATAARSSAYAGMRRALASASDTSAIMYTYYNSGPAHECRPPHWQSQRSAKSLAEPPRRCPRSDLLGRPYGAGGVVRGGTASKKSPG